MPTSNTRCFAYVRYWPGFTEKFPYEQFNWLRDDEVEQAVRKALARELWRLRHKIIARRKAYKLKQREAVKLRKTQALPRHRAVAESRASRADVVPNTRFARFAISAREIGWHSGGFISSERGAFNISSRVWLAEVESAECARSVVDYLTKPQYADDDEWKQNQLINPRFGFVLCNDLPKNMRASALAEIKRLWGNQAVDLGDLARPQLTRLQRFLEAWQAETQLEENQPKQVETARRDPKIEGRDKWIYDQVLAGAPHKNILAQLKKNTNGWDKVSTEAGIREAAKRYAERNRLPLPPSRKRGRPRKTK